uniref:tRNA/rRNA methyltransferase SpoU type domain-containing protein n=1 Tax=Babesia bovis TaxID=5865 RepID=A7AV85_BABBO|eukprot:XP_001609279.1 hypothetical protein [Babesia bovis T2Bo]
MFAGRRFVAEFPRHIYVISNRGSSSSTSVIVLSSKGSQVVAKDKPVTGDVVSRSILPSWLECDVVPVTDKSSAVSEVKPLRLRKIRPFSATTLSIFHPNPLCVATPSRKNAIIKHLWRLRVNSSYRKHQDTRLVTSGDVILHMLRHTDCVFGNIFTTRKSLVELILGDSSLRSRFGRIQLLDRHLLRYCLRGTSTTSDSIAEVTIPNPSIPSNPRVVIALDNIRYPQNVGNIIRIAIGLNVDGIYYLRGTADPFDWKVTQVTGGLQFKLPYQRGGLYFGFSCQFP